MNQRRLPPTVCQCCADRDRYGDGLQFQRPLPGLVTGSHFSLAQAFKELEFSQLLPFKAHGGERYEKSRDRGDMFSRYSLQGTLAVSPGHRWRFKMPRSVGAVRPLLFEFGEFGHESTTWSAGTGSDTAGCPSVPSYEKIDDRAQKREKENRQRPDDPHGGIQAGVGQSVDEHPEPKQSKDQRNDQAERTQSKEETGGAIVGGLSKE